MNFITEKLLLTFFKFAIVGASGAVIDFGLTAFFKEIAKIPRLTANSIGFITAAISNYFLNRIWTFESHNPHIGYEFSSFLLISTIGLGLNTLVIWILNKKFKMNFYAAKIIATGIVMIWNFLVNRIYTFHSI